MRARRFGSAFHHGILIVVCAYSSGIAPAHADAVSDLDDAAARMQYAFHTANVRGVEDALTTVQQVRLPDTLRGMKEYYSAYGHWKIAELYTDEVRLGRKEARSNAARAASSCLREAESAVRIDAKLAEAHAMTAICTAMATRGQDALSLGSCLRHKGLRTARELAPANPRVRLIEAQCALDTDKTATPAFAESARQVVLAFETAQPSGPDWGQAEALLLLGQVQLQRGDGTAARDSIERALVIAPDYRKARELLENAASRPR